MATAKSPAKGSAITRSKYVRGAVRTARFAASSTRTARSWSDVTLPAVGAASLFAVTPASLADVVVTSAESPVRAGVASTITVAAVASAIASEHAKGARERRRIERAFRQVGIMEPPSFLYPHGRPPRVARPTRTNAGSKVRVRVPKGSADIVIQKFAPALERELGQVSVRPVAPPPNVASRTVATVRRATPGVKDSPLEQLLAYGWVELNMRRREALAGDPPAWRHLEQMRRSDFAGLSVWDGWHKGVDEDGEDVDLLAVQLNKISGGNMGTGKSTDMHVDIGAVALDPTARIFLLDPSELAELGRWVPVADDTAGDPDSCARLLAKLHAEGMAKLARIDEDRDERIAAGLHGANVERGEQTTWIFVDELLALTNHPDKQVQNACVDMMFDIVGRMRKVGYHLVVSTLKPSGDVIPTVLRDLIQLRQVFRVTTAEASTAVLGDKNWATLGIGGHKIDMDAPKGISYLLGPDGYPKRIRGCFLSEREMAEVRTVAMRLRGVEHRSLPRPVHPVHPAVAQVPTPRESVTVAAPVAVEPAVDPGAARKAHKATQFAARRKRNRPGPTERKLRAVGPATPKED